MISDIAKQKAKIIERRLVELQKQKRQKETERATDCAFAIKYRICPYCGDKLIRKGWWFKLIDKLIDTSTDTDLRCQNCKKDFDNYDWQSDDYY